MDFPFILTQALSGLANASALFAIASVDPLTLGVDRRCCSPALFLGSSLAAQDGPTA